MAETYRELRKLSIDNLIESHDNLRKYVDPSFNDYLNEIYRRDQERHTRQITWMTRAITAMTAVITFATLVNVGFFICDVLN